MMANQYLLVLFLSISVIYTVAESDTTTEDVEVPVATPPRETLSKRAPPVIGSRRFGNDALDTAAWVGGWLLTVGSYAGRQEPPFRRRHGPLDDLPNIYIPNELTGSELNRAMRLTTEEQAVAEEQCFKGYLDFFVMKRDDEDRVPRPGVTQYVDEKDGYFIASQEFINDTQVELRANGIDDELLAVVTAFIKVVHWPKREFSSFAEMHSEADHLYLEIMGWLENENNTFMFNNDEGHYMMTNRATKLLHAGLNATLIGDPCHYGYDHCDLDQYHSYKAYLKFVNQIHNMIDTTAAVLRLPGDLSWRSIKRAIQKTYKEAIPNIHLYQFLTKTLEYLDLDTNVKGMSKLSPSMTQRLIDSLWFMFGRFHPITNNPYGG